MLLAATLAVLTIGDVVAGQPLMAADYAFHLLAAAVATIICGMLLYVVHW